MTRRLARSISVYTQTLYPRGHFLSVLSMRFRSHPAKHTKTGVVPDALSVNWGESYGSGDDSPHEELLGLARPDIPAVGSTTWEPMVPLSDKE